ncbi:MAG: recombinase family protein [Ethanoligenens sp.]
MNRKNKLIHPITALYCRLSIEDGRDNESMSISNQKAMLKDYAEKNGMGEYAFYVDDGYTGRNFNRPGFKRMIADIEAGKVNCVITKDLSRLGRNYIEAGSYIEIFFPRHNVRYIALTDGVDSQNRQEIDITPFRNILNDLYSRDISKKVQAGWMARSKQGKFMGGPTPYGLIRDPNDHGHLILDPQTASTVKQIFDLASDGWGNMRIAKYLLEHKVPITRCRVNANPSVNYYSWGGSVISQILRNPVYYGAHVVCKTHQKAIRSNTYNLVPRDKREIIENCHEAIVSKEQWERVQKLIDHRPPIMQGNACPFYNLFHGLVYCETCGKAMQVRYERAGRMDINRTTKKKREPIDKAYYICRTYNRLGKNACTSHKIEARDLYNLVLADIQKHAQKALQDSDAFYAQLTKKLELRQTVDAGTLKKELDALMARSQEIDQLVMSLYEDKSKGILTERRFVVMTEQLEQEQVQGKDRVQEIMEALSRADDRSKNVRTFMEEIGQHAAIKELDEAILHRLIDRIVVGETHMESSEKIQQVTIAYNFVGDINK